MQKISCFQWFFYLILWMEKIEWINHNLSNYLILVLTCNNQHLPHKQMIFKYYSQKFVWFSSELQRYDSSKRDRCLAGRLSLCDYSMQSKWSPISHWNLSICYWILQFVFYYMIHLGYKHFNIISMNQTFYEMIYTICLNLLKS